MGFRRFVLLVGITTVRIVPLSSTQSADTDTTSYSFSSNNYYSTRHARENPATASRREQAKPGGRG